MIFSRHKKRGREVGHAIENSLKVPFFGSKYFDAFGSGKFSPPANFYKDPYVLGTVYSMASFCIQYVVGGQKWSTQKKGEFMIESFSILDPSGDQGLQDSFLHNMSDLQSDPEFKRGMNDAGTLFGVAYGIIRDDDPDPILAEARKHAISIDRLSNDIGIGGDVNSSLAAAVSDLTIGRHVRENYLEEDR